MYQIRVYEEVEATVSALPLQAHAAWIDLLGVLELTPWSGASHNEANPDAPLRQWVFGPSSKGLVVYLILERDLVVDVVQVTWVG